jgi:hypothetical protein
MCPKCKSSNLDLDIGDCLDCGYTLTDQEYRNEVPKELPLGDYGSFELGEKRADEYFQAMNSRDESDD